MSGPWEPNATGRPGQRLYHGTAASNLETILREGLRPCQPDYSPDEPTAVYLTTGYNQARANSWKHGGDGVILTVDVSGLPLVVLGFVTCGEPIGPERIVRHRIARNPVRA